MAAKSKLIELKGNLGYQRDEMPQINPAMVGHFAAWLKEEYNIHVEAPAMIRVDQIRPTQSHVNKERLDKKWQEIIDKGLGPVMKTLIISVDHHQLDGHNTIAAILSKLGGEVCVPYMLVDVPMKSLIDIAKEYPYTTYKSIDDIG